MDLQNELEALARYMNAGSMLHCDNETIEQLGMDKRRISVKRFIKLYLKSGKPVRKKRRSDKTIIY